MTVKTPNAVSLAAIVGLIALCQGLSEILPVLGQPWVPFAIVGLAALVKGLQVYLESQAPAGEARSEQPVPSASKMRRWLID